MWEWESVERMRKCFQYILVKYVGIYIRKIDNATYWRVLEQTKLEKWWKNTLNWFTHLVNRLTSSKMKYRFIWRIIWLEWIMKPFIIFLMKNELSHHSYESIHNFVFQNPIFLFTTNRFTGSFLLYESIHMNDSFYKM